MKFILRCWDFGLPRRDQNPAISHPSIWARIIARYLSPVKPVNVDAERKLPEKLIFLRYCFQVIAKFLAVNNRRIKTHHTLQQVQLQAAHVQEFADA
jgi:hypothetical protein